MAEFKFSCPQCGQNIQCGTDYAGKQINCPACQKPIVVPSAPRSAAVPVPPLAAPSRSMRQGTPARAAGQEFSGAPVPVKTRTPQKVLVIVAAVVVLAGLVIGGWYGYSKYKIGNAEQNLIGWWKLNDGSGTVAKDSSRLNGDNGQLVNGPEWVKGRRDGALKFNGSQYVSLGNIFQGSYTEISIACWIKHSRSGWQDVVVRSSWGEPDGIGLNMDDGGASIDFGRYPLHPGQGFAKSNTNVQDDRWHHVVGTLRPNGSDYIYSIYVDGKLDNTWTDSVKLTPTSHAWTIGARYDGTWGYRGLVEDVRIYDRALPDTEIQAIYAEQK